MGRFAHSWELFKTSYGVLKQDKELMWMPVLSGLASIVTVAAIVGVGWLGGVWPQTSDAEGGMSGPGIALAFLLYVLLAFVALFFNAAVVAGASERLAGGDPTVGSALRKAWSKAGRLFLWSIVVATVNVILQAIRERSDFLGRILVSIAGMAWNLATYFMVPVLLFENEGIGTSLRRSGGLFRKTWGETVVGEGGIGLASTVVTIAVAFVGFLLTALLAAALGTIGLVLGIIVTVLAIVLTVTFFTTVAGVYKAALYRFVSTGETPAGFRDDQMGGQFHQAPA